jgi:hypothetical protein
MEKTGRCTGNGVRTFSEIGKLLGIEANTAQALYSSGMKKLRSRRFTPAFRALLELAERKEKIR